MSSGGSGGNTTTNIISDPWAPATGQLSQVLSEAQNIYGLGPSYVSPTTQTMQGLAAQEQIAGLANQQIASTIQGQYSNPFLNPIIANAAQEAYTNVASQFTGAGRTPGGTLSQQQAMTQVANVAAPLAFQSYENERQRQLSTAQQVPSLTAVGQTLEDYEMQRQQAPYNALLQYANIVNPVARGGSSQQSQTLGAAPNRLGTAAGGALIGSSIGSQLGTIGGYSGAAVGGLLGALGGLL
jgi:hypothetical protein